ncbi:hypothetical protein MKQ68_12275 [Chitinophaga horti]|uniref:Anti-sigma factor n=1 Tax=Chitinophaga horti TaxID=2920382 RepID=A0ABY6JC61_9BACT|nr:hypothetical protein [Chitinophaga horti]UYQ95876.1 hypothetical protein MKQ68_12275 [Chitinophaga horti]
MNKQRLHQLFWKYVDEQLTAAEELEFLALMAQPEARHEADRLGSELWETRYQQASFPADDHSQRRIDAVMKKLQPKKVVRLRYWMAAACTLLLAGTAWWLTSPANGIT